jgi:hypothetical protein
MDDLERFCEPAIAMVRGVAEGLVLRVVIPGPQAEDESPSTDLVDGIRHFCQHGGIAEAATQH